MAARVPLSKLRGIKLPPANPMEPDHITSIRRCLAFHQTSPETMVLAVTDEIAAMLPSDDAEPTAVAQPTAKAPKTLKS